MYILSKYAINTKNLTSSIPFYGYHFQNSFHFEKVNS